MRKSPHYSPNDLMSCQASNTGIDPPQALASAYQDPPLPPALPSCHSNDSKPLSQQLHVVLQKVDKESFHLRCRNGVALERKGQRMVSHANTWSKHVDLHDFSSLCFN
ncbi:uncharacterized protein [Elaeis guineensis]|uniref:uncharacterized protein n=1 Tax=Elaeis guineensis var. tenera TaxID=51953 RepID=UPI003C6CF824